MRLPAPSRSLIVLISCTGFAACAFQGASIDHGGQSLPGGISGGLIGDPVLGEPEIEVPTEEGGRREVVRGELYSLVAAQREYRTMNGTYARSLSALEQVVDYAASDQVTVRIFRATEAGYSAISRASRYECAVFIGLSARPRDYAIQEGIVGCNYDP